MPTYLPVQESFDSGFSVSHSKTAGATASGGRLRLALNTTFEFWQVGPYDWTGKAALVEVVSMPSTAGSQFNLQARNPTNSADEASFQILGGTLRFRQDNTQLASITWDPVAHRWLRLQMSGSNLLFETSPDGLTFTTRHTVAAAFNITNSNLRLFANATSDVGEGVLLDNVNLEPAVVGTTGPTILRRNAAGTGWEKRKLLRRNAAGTGWDWG